MFFDNSKIRISIMPEVIQLYKSVLNIEKSKYCAETRGKLGLWTHVDSDAGIERDLN